MLSDQAANPQTEVDVLSQGSNETARMGWLIAGRFKKSGNDTLAVFDVGQQGFLGRLTSFT